LNQTSFSLAACSWLLGEQPMKTFQPRSAYHVSSRVHRLDPRQESRRSLALIMLLGLATLSVMATTQTLSAQDTKTFPIYSQR
jgi:hypothetical protein